MIFMQFVKRDAISSIEKVVQEKWKNEKIFEQDAPEVSCYSKIDGE